MSIDRAANFIYKKPRTVKPFRIDASQGVLDDLHDLLQRIRWPAVISGQNYGRPEFANMKDPAKKHFVSIGIRKRQGIGFTGESLRRK